MGFKIPAKCEHCRYREGIECTYGSPICPVSVQTQTSMTIYIEKVIKGPEEAHLYFGRMTENCPKEHIHYEEDDNDE